MLRIQGAILSQIPARMLVHPLPPGKWRKLVGLPGNASKEDVAAYALSAQFPVTNGSLHRHMGITTWTHGAGVPQDAHDAHLIALATRSLITQEKAA